MVWKTTTLGEVCLRITDGSHWSPKGHDQGIPMASVKDMTDYGFNIEKCKFISLEDYHKLVKNDCKPLSDDVLIAKDGSYLKHVFVWKQCIDLTILSSIAILRPNKTIIDPKFLSAYLASPVTKSEMAGYVSGVALPRIILKDFIKFKIKIPSLPTQRKIAAILSAYDDLIENNLRRIKILEEMAQNIYREWFVKFRFPGYQHSRFTDSLLGRIPEGWEAVRFSDLLASGLGGDWGLDEPDTKENAPVFVIRGTDFDNILNGTTLRTPRRFITLSSQTKRQLQAGDLLVENSINAKSRCVGTTLLITDGVLRRLSGPAIAASFCKVYRFKNPPLAPLAHLHMRHLYEEGRMAFYQNVAANGIGNFQSQRFLESEYLVFPADSRRQQEMLDFLTDLTSSTLADQTFILRRTRDLLLPRLISGEVDVSNLDIAVPEEANA